MSRTKSKQLVKSPTSRPEPTAVFMHVSPEVARDWLDNYNSLNRPLRPFLAEKYTRDMINDKWLTTDDGVSFDWDGVMLNGQHTCTAIVQSGKTQKILVVKDLDPKTRMVIGIGATRRPADILKLLGWPASTRDVAIVRSMMNGAMRRATIPEIVDAYEIHHEAAHAVMAMFPNLYKRNLTVAPVLGPMARAWYSYDRNKLQRFADILYSGLSRRKGDLSAVILRDFLLTLPHRGESLGREMYKYTETSLYSFLNDIKLDKLIPTKEELFPLITDNENE